MFGRGNDKEPKPSFADRLVGNALGGVDASGNLGGLGVMGALSEAMGALNGDARPHRLAEYSAMSSAKATIVANEGWSGGSHDNMGEVLQHQKYIVDVHPDSATDPAFRTELMCWVSWPDFPDFPDVGDAVAACYTPGTKEAILLLSATPSSTGSWRDPTRRPAMRPAARRCSTPRPTPLRRRSSCPCFRCL